MIASRMMAVAAIPAGSIPTSTRRPGSGSARWARPKGKNADDDGECHREQGCADHGGRERRGDGPSPLPLRHAERGEAHEVLSGGRHRPLHEQSGEHRSSDADRDGKGKHGSGHEAQRVGQRSARLLARVLAGGVVPRDLQGRGPDFGHPAGLGASPTSMASNGNHSPTRPP